MKTGSCHGQLRVARRILSRSNSGRFSATVPVERTPAMLWVEDFLIELARDDSLPLAIRQQAVAIA
ncbi:MAG TPA: BPSL0761 family protein, partial [Rhodanobacteraceae bacterium]|nr:BPSL0761 family protein [Rhodanobacteraceae bacterium]